MADPFYTNDRVWSDGYLREVTRALAPHVILPTSVEVDCSQASDLTILKTKVNSIGVRIRRPGYAEQYPFDFTIRSARPSGAKVELAKILEGLCDWMFYGHGQSDGTSLASWWLIDLDVFRREFSAQRLTYKVRRNQDGTEFHIFNVQHPGLVLDCSFNELVRLSRCGHSLENIPDEVKRAHCRMVWPQA